MDTEPDVAQRAHHHNPHHAATSASSGIRYTCPMHPEIVSDAPGSCPKCGMALTPILQAEASTTEYTCPMHPQVRSPTPGSCPICGMALVSVAGRTIPNCAT